MRERENERKRDARVERAAACKRETHIEKGKETLRERARKRLREEERGRDIECEIESERERRTC